MARFSWPTQWRFRNRILLMLGLFAFAFIGPFFAPLWAMTDLDPGPTIVFGYIGTWGSVLCWALLAIWLLFFSYVPFKIRMALLVLFFVHLALIDDIQLDSYRRPILHYRWESHPEDELAKYLEEQPNDPDAGPVVNVEIDPINDYPRYRGLRGDGIANPTELLDFKWKTQPIEKWRHPCGGGFSGFAVAGNAAITLEQRKSNEAIVCYDRDSGVQRWVHEYPAAYRHLTDRDPRATPTIADGAVYSLGALGDLVCVEGPSGNKRWARNILRDGKAKRTTWGMTSSPLVVDGLIVVNAGIDPDDNAGRAVIAYRVKDGEIAWAAGSHPAGYSSPLVAELAGKRQIVLFDNAGVAGYDIDKGAELWRFAWPMANDGNVPQPLIIGQDRVFISSETSVGCAMIEIKRTPTGFAATKVWSNKNLCALYSNPVRLGRAIYGLSFGYLVCLDVETGHRYWRGKRSYGNGQVIAVGGHLLVQTEKGELLVAVADTKKLTIQARFDMKFDRRIWNTPAPAGRYLYVRNDAEMACFELPLRE